VSSELEKAVVNDLQAQSLCAYCGAPLNHAFYFCLSCATPYKALTDIIGPYIPRPLTESELIRKKAPRVWTVFWTYAILIFVVGLLSLASDKDDDTLRYALLLGGAAFTIVTVFFEIIYWPSLVVQLKRIGFTHWHAWAGLGLLPVLLALNFALHSFVVWLEPGLHRRGDSLQELNMGPAALFILICLIPGITEEIAFRGLIQHWLQTAIRPWHALILASALFTALHLSVISAPYIFLLGMVLGWVKLKTGSLYPSMLIHMLHNCAVIWLFPLMRI